VIFILDYGASNLRSVKKALDYLGIAARVAHQPSEITSASKILLPGVGAFGKGMEALCRSGFAEAIAEHVDKGRDLLGICLGMQLLLTQSEEMGRHDGLNLLEGYVRQFDKTKDKVPQIGWNSLDYIRRDSVLLEVSTKARIFTLCTLTTAMWFQQSLLLPKHFMLGSRLRQALRKIISLQFSFTLKSQGHGV
jgi:imidazole glycerol phosphate synthase glutamine amidotransferase subunit